MFLARPVSLPSQTCGIEMYPTELQRALPYFLFISAFFFDRLENLFVFFAVSHVCEDFVVSGDALLGVGLLTGGPGRLSLSCGSYYTSNVYVNVSVHLVLMLFFFLVSFPLTWDCVGKK